ncbi:hypothetical protein QOZ28_10545, partial [Pseudomonas aeruginosa]
DHRINTALCPGGKERMRRLLNIVASGRVNLGPLVSHEYRLDDIVAADARIANQRDNVLQGAIKPHRDRHPILLDGGGEPVAN